MRLCGCLGGGKSSLGGDEAGVAEGGFVGFEVGDEGAAVGGEGGDFAGTLGRGDVAAPIPGRGAVEGDGGGLAFFFIGHGG